MGVSRVLVSTKLQIQKVLACGLLTAAALLCIGLPFGAGSAVADEPVMLETSTATHVNAASSATWKRLSGSTAYDTMSKIVHEGAWATDTVVVATGEGFADALAASGVAGIEGAPTVLTERNELSWQAYDVLGDLNPAHVVVVGGRKAVSDDVLNEIKELFSETQVERFSGVDAHDTAVKMNLAYKGKWSSTAILATQKSYADALSAAPIAYAKHMPIFLVKNKTAITTETLSAMKQLGIKKVMVIGGNNAVAPSVRTKLANMGFTVNTRKGTTLYDTSKSVAEWGISLGLSPNKMGVATGKGYADALAGAALCGSNKAVMVLADDSNPNTCLPIVVNNKARISKGYVFGGKRAVSDTVMNAYKTGQKVVAKKTTTTKTSSSAKNTSSGSSAATVVYVTPSGKKYHRHSCPTISNSKNLTSMSPAEAKKKSYEPCKVCKP